MIGCWCRSIIEVVEIILNWGVENVSHGFSALLSSIGPVTMYTLPEEVEYLYPNTTFCETLGRWFHQALKNRDELEGYHDSRLNVERLLGLQDKRANFCYVYDVVAARKVSSPYCTTYQFSILFYLSLVIS